MFLALHFQLVWVCVFLTKTVERHLLAHDTPG